MQMNIHGLIQNFWTDAVKIVKLTIRPIGCNDPWSSSLSHVDTGPTVSSIFGMLPGSPFLSVSSILCDSACISSMAWNQHLFSFNLISGNRKSHTVPNQGSMVGGGWQPFCFSVQCRWCAAAASGHCQGPGQKLGCDMVHAQFFHQNPLACPITNSHLLSNVVNGPTSILTEELLKSCSSFRSRAACGSPCVRH